MCCSQRVQSRGGRHGIATSCKFPFLYPVSLYVSIHALIDELGDHGWCTLYLPPRRFQKKVVTVPRVVTKADLIVEPSVYSHGTPGLTGLLDGEHLRKSERCHSGCAAQRVRE